MVTSLSLPHLPHGPYFTLAFPTPYLSSWWVGLSSAVCPALGTGIRRQVRGLRFSATCDLAGRDRSGQVAG